MRRPRRRRCWTADPAAGGGAVKALVQTAVERLELQDVAPPPPRDDEVLVRIEASGICGSDMHAFLGHDARRPTPIVLGHEAAGVVVETGERVTINPLVACGTCAPCAQGRENLCPNRQIISMPPRPGAFSQLVSMPRRNLVEVPADVSLEKAALAEPIACGWHAVRLGRTYLGGSLDGVDAVVIGGGAIGVGAALCLRAQGAGAVTIVEPNAVRRAYLAERTDFAVAEQADVTVPIVVDAVGYAATRAEASRLAAPGGAIVHIGLGEATGGLDARRMTLHEIAFLGTYTYTAQDFQETAAAMFAGRLGPLDWTESRPLADGAQAFADIRAGAVAAPKIVLQPHGRQGA